MCGVMYMWYSCVWCICICDVYACVVYTHVMFMCVVYVWCSYACSVYVHVMFTRMVLMYMWYSCMWCICTCDIHMCMVYIYMWRHLFFSFFGTGSLTGLELAKACGLAGELYLFLFYQHWDYKHHHYAQTFFCGSGGHQMQTSYTEGEHFIHPCPYF